MSDSDPTFGPAHKVVRASLKGAGMGALLIGAAFGGLCFIVSMKWRDLRPLVAAPVAAIVGAVVGAGVVLTKTPRKIGLHDGGLVAVYLAGQPRRFAWNEIREVRLAFAPKGNAGPGGSRTRLVYLRSNSGRSLLVSESEFGGLGPIIDALLDRARDKVVDERAGL